MDVHKIRTLKFDPRDGFLKSQDTECNANS
jgi:hypothetical protein